ncbi:hypothetical protein [Penaeicola halotolerans]|uniref:hypothetical protein n=1 Tax=Penaeicola halotolerans TaxID=2793196 RepID=UPI001CF908DB|nr:hypothetical protein [Penaeicola halotolerans]
MYRFISFVLFASMCFTLTLQSVDIDGISEKIGITLFEILEAEQDEEKKDKVDDPLKIYPRKADTSYFFNSDKSLEAFHLILKPELLPSLIDIPPEV